MDCKVSSQLMEYLAMAKHIKLPFGFIFLVLLCSSTAYGNVREYHLIIDQQEVQVGDRHTSGMTIWLHTRSNALL